MVQYANGQTVPVAMSDSVCWWSHNSQWPCLLVLPLTTFSVTVCESVRPWPAGWWTQPALCSTATCQTCTSTLTWPEEGGRRGKRRGGVALEHTTFRFSPMKTLADYSTIFVCVGAWGGEYILCDAQCMADTGEPAPKWTPLGPGFLSIIARCLQFRGSGVYMCECARM